MGLFISNAIKKVNRVNQRAQDSFELLQVECEILDNKTTIIMVYRPPNASVSVFIEEFKLYLEVIDMVSANIIIWGDFNLWLYDLGSRNVPLFIDRFLLF